ncbi:MAG: YkgJ family cysteine cluster protein [Phycisphaerales bacterium]|jgi:Fe-S-cluster containining protein
MIGNPAVMKLSDSNQNTNGSIETISFDLDVLGEPMHFSISVTQKQAKLSDITPLARTLSTKIAIVFLDILRHNGQFIPCRKGCSTCCSYMIPLSVPEAFRLREDVLAMPPDQSRVTLQLCLDRAKIILDKKPIELDITEWTEASNKSQLSKLGKWYEQLNITCPFLSNGLCTIYEQRPLACREYIVRGSALLCRAEWTDGSHKIDMPVSTLECLGQLAAELEHTDSIESVILPLALPWAQENYERGNQTWPAIFMVERFIEIVKATALKNSAISTCP